MNSSIPQSNRPRVVIIGGGFGGLAAARALRRAPVQVILIDKNNYHTFQPLLYQVATAGLEPDSIGYPLRKIFKGYHNLLYRMAEVNFIDAASKKVETSIGPISYDYLIVAAGSRSNFFGMDSFSAHSMPMKSIPEAMDIRARLFRNFEKATLTDNLADQDALMTVVVVGGGPTGVETAGAIGELKRHILPRDFPELDIRRMQIHLVEAGPSLLAAMSAHASESARHYLEELGVTVWLNAPVVDFDGVGLKLKNGVTIRSGAVIWSAGVEGALIPGLPDPLIQRGNRIQVDDCCRVEGAESVYVIGDLAFRPTEAFPKGLPMVAQVAIQMGGFVAYDLKRRLNGKEPIPFEYKDLGSMATIGRNRAVVDLKPVRFSGLIAWFVWMAVHLMTLVGFRNRVVVFINWVYNYFSYDRGIRLILTPTGRKDPS